MCALMAQVGFGDITASTTMERVAAVVSMALGCGVFGIVMGQVRAPDARKCARVFFFLYGAFHPCMVFD